MKTGLRTRRRYGRRYRKGTRGKKVTKKSVYKIVKSQLQHRGLLHPEIKHKWIYLNGDAITNDLTAGPTQILGPVANGTGPSTIIGSKYSAKYLHLKGNLFNSGTETHMVRLLIIRDDQPTGSDSTLTDPALVLYSGTANWNTTILMSDNMIAPIQPYKPRRFKVLFDKIYNMFNAGSGVIKPVNKYIPLYDTAVSVTPNQTSGVYNQNHAYYFYAITDAQQDISQFMTLDFAFQDV